MNAKMFSSENGAAFLLNSPPKISHVFIHKNAQISVDPDYPYVIVQLNGDIEEGQTIKDTAWEIANEAFDIHAAKFKEPIGAWKSDHEYMTWENYGALTVHTTRYTENRCKIQASVVDSDNVQDFPAASNNIGPSYHHSAMSFYRRSLMAEDLLDAYRNAYLAIECLVSSFSEKERNETEKNWLIRVLGGTEFEDLFGGLGRSVAEFVEEIYIENRLPTFHAKSGRGFNIPLISNRPNIHQALFKSHYIIDGLLNTWGARQGSDKLCLGNGLSLSTEAQDAMLNPLRESGQAKLISNEKMVEANFIYRERVCPKYGKKVLCYDMDKPLEATTFKRIESNLWEYELAAEISIEKVKKITFEQQVFFVSDRHSNPRFFS